MSTVDFSDIYDHELHAVFDWIHLSAKKVDKSSAETPSQARCPLPSILLPSASPAVLSAVTWQLLVALLLRPAVQLLRRRPPLLRRLDNYGITSDILVANYVIGNVLCFGRIN